jgi:hypothetical protein
MCSGDVSERFCNGGAGPFGAENFETAHKERDDETK